MRRGLDAVKVMESPNAIIDQLENELQGHELKLASGNILSDASPIKEWCMYNLDLVKKTIHEVEMRSPSIQTYQDK